MAPITKTRLGYCCISLGAFESKFRTVTLTKTKSLSKTEAKEKLFKIWKSNLEEYGKILAYNIETNIWLYRISSDLFPLADHEEFEHLWDEFRVVKDNWWNARYWTNEYLSNGGRLCSHPGQFVSLGSPSKKVRKNSIKNLEHHADMFDRLGLQLDWNAPINIHLSNGKDNIKNLSYFEESIDALSDSVRKRLVFETEDKAFWTWQNIHKYFPLFPITLDFHHRNLNNEEESEMEAFDMCAITWGSYRPIMHISDGREGPNDRSHHDWVAKLPELALKPNGVDLEIEAKKKDLAVLFLKSKYSDKVI
jgi:UV DNA damage endonuclease